MLRDECAKDPMRQSADADARPRLKYWGDLCPALLAFLQKQATRRATTREACRGLRYRYALPECWMDPVESSGGEPYFENRLRFAREYLCKHGFIHRGGERGVWALTPKGIHTPPEQCPTPQESVKSKTGYTLDQIAAMMDKLYRKEPERFEALRREYGV